MSADRDLVVRLTPDPSALLEFLDTAAGALITAADTLRAAYPVAVPEPADRTGLCDQCDKPYTGGSVGGGLLSVYWCEDHDPTRDVDFVWPDASEQPADSVEEIWYPGPGDRVTIHCKHANPVAPDGTEAIVLEVGSPASEKTRVWVAIDDFQGLQVPLHELRPVLTESPAAEGAGYEAARSEDAGGTSADEPARAVAPSVVGPEPLADSLHTAYRGWLRSTSDDRATHEVAAAVVRERLAQYQGSTPVSQVFTEWFGGDQ